MKSLLDLAAADEGSATFGGRRHRDLPSPAGQLQTVRPSHVAPAEALGLEHLGLEVDGSGDGSSESMLALRCRARPCLGRRHLRAVSPGHLARPQRPFTTLVGSPTNENEGI